MKSGSEHDRSYMEHEVLDHLHDLGVGEHVLVPSAKNAQLASDLLASLEGACGGAENTSDGGAQKT